MKRDDLLARIPTRKGRPFAEFRDLYRTLQFHLSEKEIEMIQADLIGRLNRCRQKGIDKVMH